MELEYKTVRDILPHEFWIPSFQRGYRWQEIQIKNLLNDLAENKEEQSGTPYCLQPLVVKREADRLAVIDGQQRLTTIYLALKVLGAQKLFSIEYEDRPESSAFFNDLKDDDSCPDFYYISHAHQVIRAWINDNPGRLTLKDILDDARFIWYQTEENPYDVFCRLNTGKIALSNAELTKALILTAPGVRVGETAAEWDVMEQTLQNDDFWYFVNPDAENPRYAGSRMDFLIELLLRMEKPFEPEEIKRNPSCLYDRIESKSKKDPLGPSGVWKNIQVVFRRLASWYEDRDMYHLVGCLMNRKGPTETRFSDLVRLLGDANSAGSTLSEFKKGLRQEIKSSFIPSSRKIDDLNYEKDKNALSNILLLFNIALLDRQRSVQSRYPFADHQKSKWSLEHIHAKNEKGLAEEVIRRIAEISLGSQYSPEDTLEALVEKFNKQNASLQIIKNDREWHLRDLEEETHGLENLALLNCPNNAAFNNGLFMEKRALLAQWESGENVKENADSSFVPLGTKMVFFKHFSPCSSVQYLWTSEDGALYLASIKKYLAAYLGCSENEL